MSPPATTRSPSIVPSIRIRPPAAYRSLWITSSLPIVSRSSWRISVAEAPGGTVSTVQNPAKTSASTEPRRMRRRKNMAPSPASVTIASTSRNVIMDCHNDVPRGTGDGDAGGTGSHVLPAAHSARFGAGAGLRGVLHRADGAAGGFGDGDAPRGTADNRQRRSDPQ